MCYRQALRLAIMHQCQRQCGLYLLQETVRDKANSSLSRKVCLDSWGKPTSFCAAPAFGDVWLTVLLVAAVGAFVEPGF